MIKVFFIFLSLIGFCLNLDTPDNLSDHNYGVLLLLYIFILFFSRYIINKKLKATTIKFRDFTTTCFYASLALSLFYLYFCWTPYLSPSNPNWGFDPQRYYYYASNLSKGIQIDYGLNYQGVVYIFYYIFYLLGADPMIPLFLNITLTLIAVLLIIRLIKIEGNSNSYLFKYTPYMLLFPELIYYNTMPSRETLSMVFSVFAMYHLYYYIKDRVLHNLLMSFVMILALLLIRPPFAGVCIICTSIMLFIKTKRKIVSISLGLILSVGVLALGNIFNTSMESNNSYDSLNESVNSKIEGDNKIEEDKNYNSNSFTAKLIPNNPIEFIIFGIIRSIFYMTPKGSPLNIFSINSPYEVGSSILVQTSSWLLLLCVPCIFWNIRKFKRTSLLSQITLVFFIVFFLVVGMFNTNIIHDRYRIVYILFAFLMLYNCASLIGARRYKNILFKTTLFLFMIIGILIII